MNGQFEKTAEAASQDMLNTTGEDTICYGMMLISTCYPVLTD